MTTLTDLSKQIHNCVLCPLHESRMVAVPGEGPAHTPLMCIGEAPGRQEDLQGRPFVGPAGRVLNRNLARAGIDRKDVFITNVVKCRPPGNRVPEPAEVHVCVHTYLERQIALLRPRVLCLLGGVAAKALLGSERVSAARGKIVRNNQVYFVTYHPAAASRRPTWEAALFEDLCKVRRLAGLPEKRPA